MKAAHVLIGRILWFRMFYRALEQNHSALYLRWKSRERRRRERKIFRTVCSPPNVQGWGGGGHLPQVRDPNRKPCTSNATISCTDCGVYCRWAIAGELGRLHTQLFLQHNILLMLVTLECIFVLYQQIRDHHACRYTPSVRGSEVSHDWPRHCQDIASAEESNKQMHFSYVFFHKPRTKK